MRHRSCTRRVRRDRGTFLVHRCESRLLQSATLIPLSDVRDFVLETAHHDVILVRQSGSSADPAILQRYDLDSQTLLSPIVLSSFGPSDLDVSPDGQFAYVMDYDGHLIDQVQLDTGTITSFHSSSLPGLFTYEPRFVNLAVKVDGTVWATALGTTSAGVLEFELSYHPGDADFAVVSSTAALPFPIPYIPRSPAGLMVKSGDAQMVGLSWNQPVGFFGETSTFLVHGPLGDTVIAGTQLENYGHIEGASLNGDGTRAVISRAATQGPGMSLRFYESGILTAELPGYWGTAMDYDDTHHRLFVGKDSSNDVQVFDVADFAHPTLLTTLDLPHDGRLSLSPDGATLFYLKFGTVQALELASYHSASLSSVSTDAPFVDVPSSYRVEIKDFFGAVDPWYRGTVHFSSSDGLAALPSDYTFTAADAGTHTFSITPGQGGRSTVTVSSSDFRSASLAQDVLSPATTTTLYDPNVGFFAETPSHFYVHVTTLAGGYGVTGFVELRDSLHGAPLATRPLDAQSYAYFTLPSHAVGAFTMYATYTPSGRFASSTGSEAVIFRGEPTLTLSPSDAGLVVHMPADDPAVLSGTLSLYRGSVLLGTLPASSSAVFPLNTFASSSAPHDWYEVQDLTVRYSGNDIYLPAEQAFQYRRYRSSLYVRDFDNLLIINRDWAIIPLGEVFPTSGTYELREDGVVLATVPVSPQAAFYLGALPVGEHSLSVHFSGSFTNFPADTDPVSYTISSDATVSRGFIDMAKDGKVAGWAFGASDIHGDTTVRIRIDGRAWIDLPANQPRLANRSANDPHYADWHGFSWDLPLLSAGTHSIDLYVLGSSGEIHVGSRSFTAHHFLFDDSWYLAHNPDIAPAVAAGILTPWSHFISYGQFENRAPSPYFDPLYYLQHNPDVATALPKGKIDSAFAHFDAYGQRELRLASPYFSEKFYRTANPDVDAAVARGQISSGLVHFLLWGQYESRIPTATFDPAGYRAALAAAGGQAPAPLSLYAHFLSTGNAANLTPSPYFDPVKYLAFNPELTAPLAALKMTPFEHFLRWGLKEGRRFSSTYSESAYLAKNADVAAAVKAGTFASGLEHFVLCGRKEGRLTL